MAKIGEFEMSKIAPLALKDVSSSSFLFRFSFSSLHWLAAWLSEWEGEERERAENSQIPFLFCGFFWEKKVSVVKEGEAGEWCTKLDGQKGEL